jgi:prepilin-type N-terminal cleavage/methylation domain-containing protein
MKLGRGFTIIEVLVVIGIIGILTAISFPSISNIRAKNRDAERVADIATIQLGLSLYYNQHPAGYPVDIDTLVAQKYIPEDASIPPSSFLVDYPYIYVPLSRETSSGAKCTYYHLGTKLELPSGQIDTSNTFTTVSPNISNGYNYCGDYGSHGGEEGIPNYAADPLMYSVHP